MSDILFVDDDQTMRNAIKIILKDKGLEIANSKEDAIKLLKEKNFDLLLTDLHLPKKSSGLGLIAKARELNEDMYIVVVTGFASIETAVEAIKFGADDYISKEFTPDSLRLSIAKFIEAKTNKKKLQKLEAENIILRKINRGSTSLIGNSPIMKEIKKKIDIIGKDNESTVVILGESGTGKELAANEIHNSSNRNKFSFIPIDCPTIPKDLFEAELFGYEKGGFTDAKARKMGRIELADKGTLFLDEIGDLPLQMQAKLLRFLETSEFYRIGGTKPIKVDVRVLSSTNRDLYKLVKDGLFRKDLFYRLQVVVITMPELKERNGDVELLAQYFLNKNNLRKGKNLKLSIKDIEKIVSHSWPGNVRELKNNIESFSVLGELPLKIKNTTKGNFKEAKQKLIQDFENEYFKKALSENDNNITRTAKIIGISREELSRKIKKLNFSY
jgi:two-component system nitrogen regulation response regulator NtrX